MRQGKAQGVPPRPVGSAHPAPQPGVQLTQVTTVCRNTSTSAGNSRTRSIRPVRIVAARSDDNDAPMLTLKTTPTRIRKLDPFRNLRRLVTRRIHFGVRPGVAPEPTPHAGAMPGSCRSFGLMPSPATSAASFAKRPLGVDFGPCGGLSRLQSGGLPRQIGRRCFGPGLVVECVPARRPQIPPARARRHGCRPAARGSRITTC